MKKVYVLLLLATLCFADHYNAQTTYTSAISDITLQCSGGTGNRTGVAYNPCFNLYYSVNAGSGSYPIETFPGAGGTALNSTSQSSDYRGLWFNNINNRLEGNTYNSGGIYSNTLNANGYAQSGTSFIASATMPNVQSAGHANVAGNIIYYYNSGTLYRYSISSNTLISSTSITGLPTTTANLNTYGIVYTGFPGADVAVYNYVNKIIYFLNSTTAAYSASCALPSSAPAPASFMMGFANNRFFLYNSSASQWYGYPVSNGPSGPSPTASVTANTTLVCAGNPVNLTASGAATYTWSSGAGNSSTAVVVPTVNTVYSVTATGSTGCTGTNTIAISVIPGAIVSAAATPTAICTGGTATLTGGGGVNSYTWSNSSNSQAISVNPSSTTSYTVMGTNSVGCVSSAVITLTVNGSAPVLSVTQSTNQTCLGKTATLTASGALTYSWSNNVSNGVSFNPSVTTTYSVTGQNGCGTSSAVATITVAPLPVTVISTPTIVCAGQNATLFASSAATSYTWFPINSATNVIIVSPTVTSTYTVAVSDGTCAGLGLVNVAANPNPTISASVSSSVTCVGDVVTLNATSIGGNSYSWTPGNLSGASVTVSPTTPIQYSVSTSNSFGCLAGAAVVVIVNPSPTVNVTVSDALICVGGTSSLTVTGSANSYSWDTGATSQALTVNPLTTTSYTVIGFGNNNCMTSSVVTVAVFDPTFAVSGNTTICSGESSTLTASGASNYTWVPNIQNAVNYVNPLVTTIYSVSAISTSANISCSSSNTIQVTVNPNPTVTAVSSRTAICKNESVTVSASGANTYSWSNAASTPTTTFSSNLVTTLLAIVSGSNSFGCSSSATVQIKVNSCAGLNEEHSNSSFIVYPNPNNGKFTIQSSLELSLIVYNAIGQQVAEINLSAGNNYTTEMSNLSGGVYFVVGTSGNKSMTKKIIVRE